LAFRFAFRLLQIDLLGLQILLRFAFRLVLRLTPNRPHNRRHERHTTSAACAGDESSRSGRAGKSVVGEGWKVDQTFELRVWGKWTAELGEADRGHVDKRVAAL